MNYNENEVELHSEILDEIDDASKHKSLFIGDHGTLPLETRRLLVHILTGPALDGRRHAKLWQILMRDLETIQRYLAELFLTLIIDRDLQVAFTRQADTGDLDTPILLRRAPLIFVDSILLLYLRQKLTQADAQGERCVVALEEIIEYLRAYEHSTNTDHAGFIKRVHASVEKIRKCNILQKIKSGENRFEISPVLKLLFAAENVQSLTALYQNMATQSDEVD